MFDILEKYLSEGKDISSFFEGYRIFNKEKTETDISDYNEGELRLFFSSFPLFYSSYNEYKEEYKYILSNVISSPAERKKLSVFLDNMFLAKEKEACSQTSSEEENMIIKEYYNKNITLEKEKRILRMMKKERINKEDILLFRKIYPEASEVLLYAEKGSRYSRVLFVRYEGKKLTDLEPVTTSSLDLMETYIMTNIVKGNAALKKSDLKLSSPSSEDELIKNINMINRILLQEEKNRVSLLYFSSLREASSYLINVFLDEENLNDTLFMNTLSKRNDNYPCDVLKSL